MSYTSSRRPQFTFDDAPLAVSYLCLLPLPSFSLCLPVFTCLPIYPLPSFPSLPIFLPLGIQAVEDRHIHKHPDIEQALKVLDKVFTVIFVFEMAVKMMAYGFKKYFTDAWCWLDFVIVAVSVTVTRQLMSPRILDWLAWKDGCKEPVAMQSWRIQGHHVSAPHEEFLCHNLHLVV